MDEALRDDSDPYVCFRRRETKPVRKTRRTDQQSMEKLRKLRAELETARSLLEMVTRREKLRKESLLMEHSILNQRCLLREMQQQLDIKDEHDLFPIKKKRKTEAYSGYAQALQFLYLAQFTWTCIINRHSLFFFNYSTRIKIPINKLKRDAYDADKKSAAQAAIDAEVARRRERNLGFEDVTDVCGWLFNHLFIFFVLT